MTRWVGEGCKKRKDSERWRTKEGGGGKKAEIQVRVKEWIKYWSLGDGFPRWLLFWLEQDGSDGGPSMLCSQFIPTKQSKSWKRIRLSLIASHQMWPEMGLSWEYDESCIKGSSNSPNSSRTSTLFSTLAVVSTDQSKSNLHVRECQTKCWLLVTSTTFLCQSAWNVDGFQRSFPDLLPSMHNLCYTLSCQ